MAALAPPLIRARTSLPVLALWSLVAAGWTGAFAAYLSGNDWMYNHDILIESGRFPWLLAGIIFLSGWQIMTAAMMLPPAIPIFAAHARNLRALAVLLAGFAAVWTLYAAGAFSGDTMVHRTVDSWPWLAAHPWLIAAGTLLAAGAYQFAPLKARCLQRCSEHRGVKGAGLEPFRLGRCLGLECAGCDWALMLLMFGLGIGNPLWMAGLAAVMASEKAWYARLPLRPVIGATLLLWGVLVLVHFSGAPSFLQGTG